MNAQQAKICKIVKKYKYANLILKKAGLESWEDLQLLFINKYAFPFDESEPDKNGRSIIFISNENLENDFENWVKERKYYRKPLILSIVAVVISIFTLLATMNENSFLWKLILKIIELTKLI